MKLKILSSGGQAATKKKKGRVQLKERARSHSNWCRGGGLKHGLAKSSIRSVHENVVGLIKYVSRLV